MPFKIFNILDDRMENTFINFVDDIKLQEQSLCRKAEFLLKGTLVSWSNDSKGAS